MNQIKKLQNLDSLSDAEKITGKDYKKDNETVMLGLAIQINKNKELNKLLDANDDTKFSEKTEEYLRKVIDFGFKIVLHDTFNNDGENESLYILWHDEYSLLLSFDTFKGSRNGGKVYYNWSPNKTKSNIRLTSSGGYEGFCWKSDFSEQIDFGVEKPKWDMKSDSWDDFLLILNKYDIDYENYIIKNNLRSVWVGDHDCREAIKNNMKLMAENGLFLKKWKKTPFLWLLSHVDSKKDGYSYESINEERISRLPKYIQDCINIK